METLAVPKELFSKILTDVEILIDDVESALNTKVKQRISDIEANKMKGKTEEELDNYLRNRGVKIGRLDN